MISRFFPLVIALTLLAACKDESEDVQPTPDPKLVGVYVNGTDTVTIVKDYYGYFSSWKYNLVYPKFNDTLDYSLSSSHPIAAAEILDHSTQRDSIIPTVNEIGTISGILKGDSLFLHVRPYTISTFSTYKFRKI